MKNQNYSYQYPEYFIQNGLMNLYQRTELTRKSYFYHSQASFTTFQELII